VILEGILLNVEVSGILLEQAKGSTFIPASSILHLVNSTTHP
jgi:hypothetical protein